jgi:hypothetical protein
VATGAVAIPLKLPAPDFGTVEQPGPKSVLVVAAEPPEEAIADEDDAIGDEDDAIGDEVDPEAAVLDPLELQAAAVRARPAARPVAAKIWYFITCSFERFSVS